MIMVGIHNCILNNIHYKAKIQLIVIYGIVITYSMTCVSHHAVNTIYYIKFKHKKVAQFEFTLQGTY